VTPDMTAEMRWFRSPKVGVVSFSVLKQMSYSASLSSTCGAKHNFVSAHSTGCQAVRMCWSNGTNEAAHAQLMQDCFCGVLRVCLARVHTCCRALT